MNDCVIRVIENDIATVTINRPKALNALNQEILTSLCDTMAELDQNSVVKIVILTGSGEKAFVAGADIAEIQSLSPVQAKQFAELGQRTMDKIANMRPFVIAAVNGFALGGGCELALACDIRIASNKAKLGIPEVTLGVIPGFGGTQRLPRLVGLGIAKELFATGRQVKAEEAKEIGLVNFVTEHEELMPFCMELAKRIAANSTSAIHLGKQSMNAGADISLSQALELEASLFGVAFSTSDQKEGMTAFLEKRAAEFQ
jgi:enoyl-CoA hydratase